VYFLARARLPVVIFFVARFLWKEFYYTLARVAELQRPDAAPRPD
jgi:hypothetical protein